MAKPVLRPEDMIVRVAQAMTAHDLDELMSFYEADAVLVRPDGTEAVGVEAIRRDYSEYIEKVISMNAKVTWCHVAGDIASARGWYEITFKRRNGSELITTAEPIETLRKQSDGSWRYVVDNGSGAKPIK